MSKTQKKKHSAKGVTPPKKHSHPQALKVYWPYIPMLLLLVGGLMLNVWLPLQQHKAATLAYATEMSRGGLLNGTNAQRANAGSGALTINTKLNAAAQAKANDMVARNYWSHETPDGQQPWVFIDAQGYNYQKAGENLAYGFDSSNATIIGWMNSPTHKANMLDGVFTEVGFGFANSPNYINTGEETVVVAMYAQPTYVAPPAPAPQPTAPVSSPSAPAVQQSTVEKKQKPQDSQEQELKEPSENKEIEVIEDTVIPIEETPVTTDSEIIKREPERITFAQQLTQGRAPWIAIVISLVGVSLAVVWLIKHYILVRKYIIEGEHFVAHHPLLDVVVLSLLLLAVYLGQSSGVVL